MELRIIAYGERGWLVDGLDESLRAALIRKLEINPPDGLEEYVFGYANVLLRFPWPVGRERVEAWMLRLQHEPKPNAPKRCIRIPVVYNGPDLRAVAKATALSPEAVVEIHSSADYVVRMMGFAPGFPYLDGLDPRLHLPRKDSPRNRIEPGTVAIGGSHAGIYSVASPGGWHLLGHTDLQLFDPGAGRGEPGNWEQAFALQVGDQVQFEVAE